MSHRGERAPYRIPSWVVRVAIAVCVIAIGVLLIGPEVWGW